MSTPSVYIACLASYNHGILHGGWVSLDGSEDLAEFIKETLEASSIDEASEWAIHDHEYCGNISQYEGLSNLKALSEAYQKCETSHINWEAFIAYCEHRGVNLTPDQVEKYEEAFAGQNSSLETWCEDYLEETGQIDELPEGLRAYFNIEAYARDLEINDVFTIKHQGEVLVFWMH